MHLAPKDLHTTWRGDDPNWVHKCQNGKIAHTHFGLGCSASPKWCVNHGDQHTQHPCHIWSIGPCVRRARGLEHSARRAAKVENCSKWPKMRTLMVKANEAHARLGPECAIGLVSSHVCPTYLLGVAQLLRFWEWQGRQVSP